MYLYKATDLLFIIEPKSPVEFRSDDFFDHSVIFPIPTSKFPWGSSSFSKKALSNTHVQIKNLLEMRQKWGKNPFFCRNEWVYIRTYVVILKTFFYLRTSVMNFGLAVSSWRKQSFHLGDQSLSSPLQVMLAPDSLMGLMDTRKKAKKVTEVTRQIVRSFFRLLVLMVWLDYETNDKLCTICLSFV